MLRYRKSLRTVTIHREGGLGRNRKSNNASSQPAATASGQKAPTHRRKRCRYRSQVEVYSPESILLSSPPSGLLFRGHYRDTTMNRGNNIIVLKQSLEDYAPSSVHIGIRFIHILETRLQYIKWGSHHFFLLLFILILRTNSELEGSLQVVYSTQLHRLGVIVWRRLLRTKERRFTYILLFVLL